MTARVFLYKRNGVVTCNNILFDDILFTLYTLITLLHTPTRDRLSNLNRQVRENARNDSVVLIVKNRNYHLHACTTRKINLIIIPRGTTNLFREIGTSMSNLLIEKLCRRSKLKRLCHVNLLLCATTAIARGFC